MSDKMVVLKSYLRPGEASVLANVLEREGIRTFLSGANAGDILSGYELATGGVKILVEEENVQRAHELLEHFDEESNAAPIPPWTCPQCESEIDEGFEVCWSCGFSSLEGEGASPQPEDFSSREERFVICHLCGAEVYASDDRCSRCGEPKERTSIFSRLKFTLMALFIVILLVILGFLN